MTEDTYLLSGQDTETARLQLQSRVWEPAGRRLLDRIGDGQGTRVVDVGCGAMGWLRLLSEWVGPDGEVVGTDVDDAMLAAAKTFVDDEGLGNVTLVTDDVFSSELEPSSFDLVHARFLIGPLGRGPEQMATHRRLVRPSGVIALEELDPRSWTYLPPAPALASPLSHGDEVEGLIPLLAEAFRRAGGDPDCATTQIAVFHDAEIEPHVAAEVESLPPGHPYLRLPLVFATALDGLLRSFVDSDDLDRLLADAERELADPRRWGLTFTLVQSWGRT